MITRSKSKNKTENENKLLHRVEINFDSINDENIENKPLYKVEIDFDYASRAWRENKISTTNGCYRYLCKKRSKNNNKCFKNCLKGEEYCITHFNILKKDID
jgi:hypothetical protein